MAHGVCRGAAGAEGRRRGKAKGKGRAKEDATNVARRVTPATRGLLFVSVSAGSAEEADGDDDDGGGDNDAQTALFVAGRTPHPLAWTLFSSPQYPHVLTISSRTSLYSLTFHTPPASQPASHSSFSLARPLCCFSPRLTSFGSLDITVSSKGAWLRMAAMADRKGVCVQQQQAGELARLCPSSLPA